MLKQVSRPKHQRQRQQRGAVMILFGLTMVVLIGFAGLAIDLGRFFVIKTELQNAMDACALSAASQLRPGLNTAADLNRAVTYGRVFTTGGTGGNTAIMNKANFQSATVNLADSNVTFAKTETFNAPTYALASTVDKDYRYAKCEFPLTNLPIYFMRVLNLLGGTFTTQSVSAMAVAKGGPQTCNIIPVGVCPKAGTSGTSTPPYGFNVGDWLKLGDPSKAQVKGFFQWIQFPGQANGASGVRDALLDQGDCATPTSASQSQGGVINEAEWAWNKRLGIYKDADRPSTVPPDHTGYSYFNQTDPGTGTFYTWANWPIPDLNPGSGSRAYPHYSVTALSGFLNYSDSFPTTPPTAKDPGILQPKNQYIANDPPNPTELAVYGKTGRRLVVIPIMSCTDTAVTQILTTGGTPVFACALMLNPFGQVGGDKISGKIEYLGLLGTGSPCGSGTVVAPKLSVLVK